MTAPPNLPNEAARYLRQVQQSLRTLPPEDRSEIVEEIRGHLLDQVAHGGSQAVQDSLAAFGTAESFASAFLEDANIRSAIASRSAGGMLLHILNLAGRGAAYFVTSLIVLFLFALAISLGFISILKPVFPDWIGFWTFADFNTFAIGFLGEASRAGGVEHLGYWIIPLGLTAGLALFSLANVIMRHTLTRWVHREHSLTHSRWERPEGLQ